MKGLGGRWGCCEGGGICGGGVVTWGVDNEGRLAGDQGALNDGVSHERHPSDGSAFSGLLRDTGEVGCGRAPYPTAAEGLAS